MLLTFNIVRFVRLILVLLVLLVLVLLVLLVLAGRHQARQAAATALDEPKDGLHGGKGTKHLSIRLVGHGVTPLFSVPLDR